MVGPLSLAEAARSPVFQRVVFVAVSDPAVAAGVVADLGARDGVATMPTGTGLFVEGLPRLFGNFLSGEGGGLSALVDETEFIAAVRALADDAYRAVLEPRGARLVVDWSPGINQPMHAEIARAVYPDALWLDDAALELGLPALPDAVPASMADAWPASPFRTRVVFIVGSPRSGTTWLAGLLLCHPEAAGLLDGETWLFQGLRDLWTSADLARWMSRDALAAAVRRFADRIFAAYRDATRPSATFFVEKSPVHAFRLKEMAEAYPDAAYISIVRDGRDVARSMVDVDLGTDDLARAARYWADSVRAARRDGAPLERFREVRYEQLVADPVGGVAELMAWVGMEVDDGVRAAIAERAGVRVSEHGSRGPVGPGKWRTMDSADVAVVEREAGDLLVELGYAEARPKRWRRR